MRLIDADALIEVIDKKFQEHYGKTVYQFIHDFFRFVMKQIKKAPTIEAEPVKHGQWIEYIYRSHCNNEEKNRYRCSICYHIEKYPTKYCADCGAKMDLEVTNGLDQH